MLYEGLSDRWCETLREISTALGINYKGIKFTTELFAE